MFVLGVSTSTRLAGDLRDNYLAVSVLPALPLSADAADFWRGAGSSSEGAAWRALIARAYAGPPVRSGCPADERAALVQAVARLDRWRPAVRADHVQSVVRARERACAGRPSEALDILDRAERPALYDIQRVALLRQLGDLDRAADIVTRHLCPTGEGWCGWAVAGRTSAGAPGKGGNRGIMRGVQRLTTDDVPTDLQSTGALRRLSVPNVTVEADDPLVVSSVVPRSRADNYVEYETVPASNPVARLHVRGAVFGGSTRSCLLLRLVYWRRGGYLDEVESRFPVEDEFDLQLWVAVPDKATALTPRLTFDSGCLSEGQKLAIGLVELGLGRRPR